MSSAIRCGGKMYIYVSTGIDYQLLVVKYWHIEYQQKIQYCASLPEALLAVQKPAKKFLQEG